MLSVGLASAQGLRVEAGLSASNVHIVTPQLRYSGDVRYGYRLGLGTELKLNERWYLAPMLTVRSAGAKLNLRANLTGEAKEIISIDDLPTSINWRSMLGDRTPELVEHEAAFPVFVGMQMRPFATWFGIKLEAGPYVGYTFSSRLNVGNYALDLSELRTLSGGIVERYAWDGGVSGSIALSVLKVYLKAGLEYGLFNRFRLRQLDEGQRRSLEDYLASVPALRGLSAESLMHVGANNLNFHLTLGVIL